MVKKPTYDELEQRIHELEKSESERKQAVKSLKESEEKHRALIENLSDLILILDKDGINVWSSPASRQYGLEPEYAIGRPFDEFVHQDDLEKVRKLWDEVIANPGKRFVSEHRSSGTPENPETWIYQHNIMEYLPDVPGINGVVVVCRNETKQKIAEKALRNEKNFIDMAIDSLPGIFYFFTEEGKFLRWNQNFETVSGYTPAEISTMHPREFFPAEEQALVEERIGEVFSDGESFVEANWLSKDGTKTLHYLTGVRVDIEGSLYQVGMGVDISGRKRAEEEREKLQAQLQQSQKMEAIGTLAGGIAHDFNNMLGIIIGNISYALSNVGKDDELFKVLSDVQDASKQAQSLTHQLLTFSKGGAPVKKTVDINKLINEAAVFSIRGAEAKCKFEFSNDLWASEVDEGQINQVIGNLVINANQAMPNGGTITIRTENVIIEEESSLPISAGRYIRIVFEDQGVGIMKDHLQSIFEPYFTTKQKGSGLGLATTFSIVKKHGGHITVYSEVGKGTVFNIYLPASSICLEDVVYSREKEHQGRGRILIMDDQELILEIVRKMLKSMGYETTIATDGAQVIEIYKEAYQSGKPFDLVILDLTVPGGMGGARTIPGLLKIDPDVKAVVSSGYSNDSIMACYEDYGFCGVIPKPFTKTQLSDLLNKMFDEND